MVNPRRSRAIMNVLKKEPRSSASHRALSRHAHQAAKDRGPLDLKQAAAKAVRTKGAAGRKAAARKAARTRAKGR
jgi:hypothetical protein